jgi:PhnB protein
MTGLAPYILFPGNAREALLFYADTFGGTAALHSFAEFGRTDGPSDAIAHGELTGAPLALYGADAAGDQAQGLMMSLLGTADPTTLRGWFSRLGNGGTVLQDLQERNWGAYDGQVIDRYGVRWLIGYQGT